MFTLITRWFEQVSVSQDYARPDYVVLWIILGAGVVLRFFGLDNVGLHGDEETMAMPAMSILATGEPLLPSGMYYPRALINIYLMSGSVWIFGESEWALRLPSAIVGSLTGLAVFFMGRRFLPPQFNLAFVATITLLPGMIEISQTARMYVFFVTCMIWFAACLFRWERDQRVSSLLLVLVVWLLCLHFHTLAIFAAPLFLFPGLSRRSRKQLFEGTAAFLVGALFFYSYDKWISAKYPVSSVRPPPIQDEVSHSALDILTSGNEWLWAISFVVISSLAIGILLKLAKGAGWSASVPVALVGLGLLSLAVLQYHVGGLLLLFGIVFWLRETALPRAWLTVPVLAVVIISAVHLGVLHESGLYPGRKLIGALVGTPSVWPILRFLEYSPVAGALYGTFFLYALTVFIKGRRLPMNVLFFAMAVWAPLLILGFFAWYIPPRYAIGQLGFFLLCTFAGLVYLAHERGWMTTETQLPRQMVAALTIVSVLLINPVVFARTVNAGYERFPDHKGAAEYIQSLDLGPDAILIAEDVLQQTYYLGSVDYSLRPATDAVIFSFMRDGRMVDQYTGAPVLGNGAELEAVIDENVDNEVYIIGSGENFIGNERMFRDLGIGTVLKSDRLEIVYEGRDGKTRVWKKRH